MNPFIQTPKIFVILMALISLSACSSSKVEEGETPVETAVDLDQPAEAVTDAVPEVDGAQPSTGKTEEVANAPDSLAPPEDGTQMADAAQPPAPVTEMPVGDSVPEPTEAAPVTDLPIAEAPVIEEQPVQKGETFAAENTEATQYAVKKGDTLMKIAFEQYGDLYRWREIYESNRAKIKDPNHVPPGTNLSLIGAGMVTIEKNGQSYLIKRGDTLGTISSDVYGTTRKWKKLWENNRQLIKDPNRIYAGFYLYYVPENKLTREEVTPGLKKDDSASTGSEVSAAPRQPSSDTQAMPETVAPEAVAPAKN